MKRIHNIYNIPYNLVSPLRFQIATSALRSWLSKRVTARKGRLHDVKNWKQEIENVLKSGLLTLQQTWQAILFDGVVTRPWRFCVPCFNASRVSVAKLVFALAAACSANVTFVCDWKESNQKSENEKEWKKNILNQLKLYRSLLASLNIQALANSVTNGNSQIHVLGKAKMRPTTYKQRILLTLRSCSKKDLQNLDNLNDCNTRHVISCYDSVIRNIEMATYNQECLNWAVHCILLRLQSFCRIWPHKESQCILWRLTTFCGT